MDETAIGAPLDRRGAGACGEMVGSFFGSVITT